MEMNADALWCLFLERFQPTSLDREFVSMEFELAFAVNVRTALLLVEPTPACRRFADIAINTAVNYSCLRHSGKSGRVLADAHRAIDEALWRLMTELRRCNVKMDAFAEMISIPSTKSTDRLGATDRTLPSASPMPVSPL